MRAGVGGVGAQDVGQVGVHGLTVAHDEAAVDDRVPGRRRAAAQPGLDRVGHRAGERRAGEPPHGQVGHRTRASAHRARRRARGSRRRRAWPSPTPSAPSPAAAPSRSLASSIAWRASSHSEAQSADDDPSTPRPTCTPAARRPSPGRCPRTGSGCCSGSGPRRCRAAPRRRTSSSSGITQCATQVRSVHQPVRSRYSIGRQPNVASENSSSSAFSAKWVCRRTSSRSASSAERTISSSVTVNGLHGASAMRTIAPCSAIVVRGDRGLAGGEDLVVVGDHVVGRQAAVLLAQRHRAARRVEADAELAGGGDLGAEQVAGAARVQVEVVGRGRAPAEGQLGQTDERAGVHRLLVDPPPQRVQRLQPAEQRLVGHRRVGPGEVLVQVVVGVDQPGRHQAVGHVDHLGRGGRLVGRPADGLHQPAGDGHPAAGQLAPRRRPSWPRAGRCAAAGRRHVAHSSAHSAVNDSTIQAMSSIDVRGLTMHSRSTRLAVPRRGHDERLAGGEHRVAPQLVARRRPAEAAEQQHAQLGSHQQLEVLGGVDQLGAPRG